MKKLFIILPVVLVFGLVFFGCATPPTEDMNKAQDAVTRAENDANAVTYAGDTVTAARNSLNKMQDEAKAKRYGPAKTLASEAIDNAERAIADGNAAAARAKDSATNLLNSLETPLAETSNAVDTAKNMQDAPLDTAALSKDMDTANQTYADAQQNLAADDYQSASAKGQSVKSQLSDINSQLNTAVQASSRKK